MACHRSPCQGTFRYFDELPGTLRYLVEGEILRGFQGREGRGWPCHRSPCQGTGGSRAPILPHFPHTRATSREITLGAEASNLQNTKYKIQLLLKVIYFCRSQETECSALDSIVFSLWKWDWQRHTLTTDHKRKHQTARSNKLF